VYTLYSNSCPYYLIWFLPIPIHRSSNSLGLTRLNVYAGPAGFYLLRGGPNDVDLHYVAPKEGDDPQALPVYTEIPIVIQDR